MAKEAAIKRNRTQWATQFLVAAELTRRGYTVAFTTGNYTPDADLMARSHAGKQFLVDVKGLSTKNPWLVRPKPSCVELYYVFVSLAPLAETSGVRKPDEFFVLTQTEVNDLIHAYQKAYPNDKGKAPGFKFAALQDSKDAWNKLP